MNPNTIETIKSVFYVYILLGLVAGCASTKNSTDTFFNKVLQFFAITFFWLPCLVFPIRSKETPIDKDVIDKLKAGNPIAYLGDANAPDAPVYPEGSFENGTSHVTIIETDKY